MNSTGFRQMPALCLGLALTSTAAPTQPRFKAVEIDPKIQIGYAVTVADVDGDKKPDILVVDKKQICWYRNPSWEKFVMAENLTPLDNVCIAARDIDGDGKAEVAVGAQWNPGDTVNSGAVFYLVAPEDRTRKWEAIELPHEPTVHRMRWMQSGPKQFELVVAPLHGRGNKDGNGAGVRVLGYTKPADPHQPWSTEVLSDSLHMTHNLELVRWTKSEVEEPLIAGREGIFHYWRAGDTWKNARLTEGEHAGNGGMGAGEVRVGKLRDGQKFLAAVEPMHGHQLVVYTRAAEARDGSLWRRNVLDSSLKEGHALACGDLLGAGSDQIVIGWRGKNADGKVGIKLFVPGEGDKWSETVLDDNTMACEDLCLADLDGDGKLDIVASGRATKNVKIYFNQSN